MIKKGKTLVYKGISDAFRQAENGNFGRARRKMHLLDLNIDLSLKSSKGFDRLFLERSKGAMKSLKEIL